MVRLNKFLSEKGICSRREADRLIADGKVVVNGSIATLGLGVGENDEVFVCGKKVERQTEEIILAFNKPRGLVCTNEVRKGYTNIYEFLNLPTRVFSVGRLDKESEGLLLLTNQGDLANELMKARNYHEKEYIVKVDKKITDDFIKKMGSGVEILDTVTRPCVVKKINNNTFSIILTQGLNRQIRRMSEALGYKVTELQRIRFENVLLKDLKPGQYRELSKEEKEKIKSFL